MIYTVYVRSPIYAQYTCNIIFTKKITFTEQNERIFTQTPCYVETCKVFVCVCVLKRVN